MRIALVSEHASPLACLGGADAGGQNVHVAALAVELARRGHDVDVYTRRDDTDLPAQVPFATRVVVHHVDAGPAQPLPKDELLPHMDEFAERLADRWWRQRPDVALCVGLSLLAACSTASLAAMALPWLFDRFGLDPAFGSGPLATVLQDLSSILIYLAIAVAVVG